jgi:hypothetical protein
MIAFICTIGDGVVLLSYTSEYYCVCESSHGEWFSACHLGRHHHYHLDHHDQKQAAHICHYQEPSKDLQNRERCVYVTGNTDGRYLLVGRYTRLIAAGLSLDMVKSNPFFISYYCHF